MKNPSLTPFWPEIVPITYCLLPIPDCLLPERPLGFRGARGRNESCYSLLRTSYLKPLAPPPLSSLRCAPGSLLRVMGAKTTTMKSGRGTIERAFPISATNQLFYGADYNPEQWDRELWKEDIDLMRKVSPMSTRTDYQAGVNVVSLAIFSWALIEVADDKWDFSWLDEIINLLHKNGIAVDLGTATASPPPWLTTAHPEILPVSKNGETLSPGSRGHFRPTSPVFRQYALRLVRRMGERYATHPAVIAWHVSNELGPHDYSDDAAAAFRSWLKERYSSIDTLNTAWGTTFWSQRYNGFDEILPPRVAPTFINPTQQLDWARFSSDALNTYLQSERQILHAIGATPVTTNYMLAGQTKGMDVARWQVDFVSNDHYRMPSRANDADELSFSASLTSAVAGNHPWWLMEHSTSAVNWQSTNPAKKRGEMIRDSLTHVAHGADAVCFFQWRQSQVGAEKYHSSMVPHAGPTSRIFRQVIELGEHLQTLSEIKGSCKAPAQVAILWDWDSWVASELDGHPCHLDYFREALEWYVALLNLGIRVDVVPPQNDLSPFSLVIAPILHVVDDELQAKLLQFTLQGGHFITTYFSGIVDQNDHVRLGGYPGAFAEMLGIRVEEWAPLMDGETVKLDDGSIVSIWSEEVDVIGDEVAVLRKYACGEFEGLPAVTQNSCGKGSASYVSTRLGVRGLEEILPEWLRAANVESTLPVSLRRSVHQVIRTDGQTEWEFLINRTNSELDLHDVKGDKLCLVTGGRNGKLGPRAVLVFRRTL